MLQTSSHAWNIIHYSTISNISHVLLLSLHVLNFRPPHQDSNRKSSLHKFSHLFILPREATFDMIPIGTIGHYGHRIKYEGSSNRSGVPLSSLSEESDPPWNEPRSSSESVSKWLSLVQPSRCSPCNPFPPGDHRQSCSWPSDLLGS